jgi:Coenzyme PQQ synthesis protein D (PqqD)
MGRAQRRNLVPCAIPSDSNDSEMSRTRVFRVDPRRVVGETIDDETILVHLETGAYYSLKGSGSRIWTLLIAGLSEEHIVDELRRRHPHDEAQVAVATFALIEQLHDEGLLEEVGLSGESAPSPPEGTPPAEPFEPPVFERFTDMENFLRVDPIHEAGEGGWPHARLPDSGNSR